MSGSQHAVDLMRICVECMVSGEDIFSVQMVYERTQMGPLIVSSRALKIRRNKTDIALGENEVG